MRLSSGRVYLVSWVVAAVIAILVVMQRPVTAVASDEKPFAEILSDVSEGAVRVSTIKGGSGQRRICILEEKHTSVASQIEIALVLVRLHDRYGLRHIALEGLVKGREVPSVHWFRTLGGDADRASRDEVAVRLLQQGEINAVEFLILVYPDVVVHAADDAKLYAVKPSDRAHLASVFYLLKIALGSVRDEHVPRIEELQKDEKIEELLEYIISLDDWARSRYEALKERGSKFSTREMLEDLTEIEERAEAVGAPILPEEKAAMSEMKDFLEAAMKRSDVLAQNALDIRPQGSMPLVALKVGAAHTEEIATRLDKARVTYGVLTPLSMDDDSGDLSFEAFESKNKLLSVDWTGEGLGSFLDGRRMPRPVVGETWLKSKAQLYFATALIARMARSEPFPNPDAREKIDALDQVKIDWDTVEKQENGDVIFKASAMGAKAWVDVWARCGLPEVPAPTQRPGESDLERLLRRCLEEVRSEERPRTEAVIGALEKITLDVAAKYAPKRDALLAYHISG